MMFQYLANLTVICEQKSVAVAERRQLQADGMAAVKKTATAGRRDRGNPKAIEIDDSCSP